MSEIRIQNVHDKILEKDDLEFRCNSCDFQTKEKKCLVKCFKCDKLPDYPNFGSMGDH